MTVRGVAVPDNRILPVDPGTTPWHFRGEDTRMQAFAEVSKRPRQGRLLHPAQRQRAELFQHGLINWPLEDDDAAEHLVGVGPAPVVEFRLVAERGMLDVEIAIIAEEA